MQVRGSVAPFTTTAQHISLMQLFSLSQKKHSVISRYFPSLEEHVCKDEQQQQQQQRSSGTEAGGSTSSGGGHGANQGKNQCYPSAPVFNCVSSGFVFTQAINDTHSVCNVKTFIYVSLFQRQKKAI